MAIYKKDRYKRADSERAAARPMKINAPGYTWVPAGGFSWIEDTAASTGKSISVLSPNSPDGRLVELPTEVSQDPEGDEAYLRFARAELTQDGLLKLANRYGYLGVSPVVRSRRSESLHDWLLAVSEFQQWFKAWELLGKKKELQKHLGKIGCVTEIDGRTIDPVANAQGLIAKNISQHLHAGIVHYLDKERPAILTPHVMVVIAHTKVRGLQMQLVPSCTLSAVWMQFAQLVTGSRRARACEICGGLMDVSAAARPNSKRIHPRCGRARSMQKWRTGKAAG